MMGSAETRKRSPQECVRSNRFCFPTWTDPASKAFSIMAATADNSFLSLSALTNMFLSSRTQSRFDGVSRIGSEQEMSAMRFDLIMALGVLEHCSDPGDVVAKLRSYLLPGSLLVIGVPYERYGLRFAGKGNLYRGYLNALLHFPAALVAVDFYSTLGRVRLGGIPPLGLIKCHEHLNFFDQRSMTALLERSGFEIIDSSIDSIVKYPARVESLQVLARRS